VGFVRARSRARRGRAAAAGRGARAEVDHERLAVAELLQRRRAVVGEERDGQVGRSHV
jgi:hypothetical protein